MKRVVVIGGGFAGTAVVRSLAGASELRVVLIDKKESFEFLPMLPEVLGRRMAPSDVAVPLEEYCAQYGASFVRRRVSNLDLDSRRLTLGDNGEDMEFDYVVVATGAVTSFHGNEDARASAHRLRRLSHATSLLEALRDPSVRRAVVVGGGYTGVEAATHLRRYAQRSGKELEIILSEIHPTILAMRPVWMQEYMERQLQELDIEVRTEATLESVSGGVRLTTGEEVTDAIVLWNAGVHASSPLSGGPVELDKKGRIVVDEALRAAQGCYVAGDAARFARSDSDEPLFMSSYFAEQEGIRVAKNLIREVAGSKPERYRPLDYGFVIPLANGRGCGTILGRDLRGKIPILIHHGAGWKRARSPETRWSRLKAVLKEGTGI